MKDLKATSKEVDEYLATFTPDTLAEKMIELRKERKAPEPKVHYLIDVNPRGYVCICGRIDSVNSSPIREEATCGHCKNKILKCIEMEKSPALTVKSN